MGYIREVVEMPATNKSIFQEDMHFVNWTEHGTQNDAYGYGSYFLNDNKWEGNTCYSFELDIAKRINKIIHYIIEYYHFHR